MRYVNIFTVGPIVQQ